MLIVVPVSVSDQHLIPHFTAALKRCGYLKQHNCLVVASPSAAEQAQKVADTLEELSSGCKLVRLEADPYGGWPQACNIHYHDTVEFLARSKNQQFWYWMELDNTPLKPGWADELEKVYHRERKPYMGALAPTWKIDNPGTPKELKRQEADHMVGTGIYPANHHARAVFWRYVNTGMPFDVAQQYEVGGPNNANIHNTSLIQHQWGVVNFRREGDAIVCDDKEKKFGISYAGPLSDEAVVHHGCKDGSLSDLLCKPESKKSAPAAPAPAPPPKVIELTGTESVNTNTQAVVETVDVGSRHTIIRAMLAKGGLKYTTLASEEKVTADEMKTWLEANGYRVAPGGWIKPV